MNEQDLGEDAAQDGLLAAFTELLRDPQFYALVGALGTVYGVTARKVTSIDQRSFTAAKQRLQAFLARTSGWNAKLSRETRNGSWRRGAIHQGSEESKNGRQGDLVDLGRRCSGLGGPVQAPAQAADTPQGVQQTQGPAMKDRCPGCQARATKVWKIPGRGLVCPHCVRSKCKT